MSLLNFSESSVNQLRALLGTYGNEKIGRILKSSSSYVESRWFKVSEEVTIEVEGEDDTYEYKAQEVKMDGTLLVNGIIFDSDGTNTNSPDDPVYFKNLKINSALFTGAVEVGKAYQVEFIAPSSYEEETQYYIIPKGGGGSILYGYIKSGSGNTYIVDVYSQPELNDKFKIDEDIDAIAYNVIYGDVAINNFLIFSYGDSEETNAKGYLTSSVWL